MPLWRLRNTLWLSALCAPLLLQAAEVRSYIVLGALPVAGFQYYTGRAEWDGLQVGDDLVFIRETDNAYDSNAVRIEWRGKKLGYVPRAGNSQIARLLDQGKHVSGRIINLHKGRSHWQRILFEALLDN